MKASTLRVSINAVLALCVLSLTLLIVWRLYFAEEVNSDSGIQLIQPRPLSAANLNWRWFGEAQGQRASGAVNAPEEQLAEANIRAELLGVVRTPDFATATIRVNGQAEKVFSIGDELQSGVELVSVTTSRVILDERGRRVQITMRRPEGIPLNPAPSQQVTQDVTELQNGFSLANMFTAVPVQLENNISGYKLDSLSEEMQTLTDIQEGDVIVQIGSNSINELMSNPGQWMNYSTETSLPVTVMRDGQETTVYVNAFSLSARILPNLTTESMQ